MVLPVAPAVGVVYAFAWVMMPYGYGMVSPKRVPSVNIPVSAKYASKGVRTLVPNAWVVEPRACLAAKKRVVGTLYARVMKPLVEYALTVVEPGFRLVMR